MAYEGAACPHCHAIYRSGFDRCPRDGGVLEQVQTDPLVGSTLANRYLVEECVGEGAMGRVYRARHVRLSRRFAIKVMFGEIAAVPELRARFANEAEAAGRLDHTNVVSVVDFGETEQGLLYLAMDFVEGETLADLIDDHGPLPEERAIKFVRQLCAGLGHAHEHGLVHRDFKPDNVIVAKGGVLKILDFGLVLLMDEGDTPARLTTEGVAMGTPIYMAPEQACGESVDHRVDLFSLGVVLYEMLAGKPPFDGGGIEVARLNVTTEPPAIRARTPTVNVSAGVERIVRRLLAKAAKDRYQSVADVLEAFDQLSASVSAASLGHATKDHPEPGRVGAKPTTLRLVLFATIVLFLTVFSVTRGWKNQQTAATKPAMVTTPPQSLRAASGPAPALDASALVETTASPSTDKLHPASDPPSVKFVEVPKQPRTRRRGRTRRRESRRQRKSDSRKNQEKGRPDSASGKAAPPSVAELTRAYTKLGNLITQLESEGGSGMLARFRKQYFAIPYADAIRRPDLRDEVARKIRRLSQQVRRE